MTVPPAVRPITDVAASLGIQPGLLLCYGTDKAKVELAALDSGRPPGRLLLVSAITPTDAGEGTPSSRTSCRPARACRPSCTGGRLPTSRTGAIQSSPRRWRSRTPTGL